MMRRILFFAVMAMLSSGSLWSQTIMTLVPMDGGGVETELSDAIRMTFRGDSIFIANSVDDGTLSLPFSDVRKLFFTENTNANVKNVEYPMLILFPNPVSDSFTIEGEFYNEQLVIYSLTSKEMKRVRYNSNDQVDVSAFPPGNYLLRIGNRVGKFAKK